MWIQKKGMIMQLRKWFIQHMPNRPPESPVFSYGSGYIRNSFSIIRERGGDAILFYNCWDDRNMFGQE